MQLRPVFAALALSVALGCGIGALLGDDGEACRSDSNCTSNKVCCDGVCRSACDPTGDLDRTSVNTALVRLQVVTDMAPLYEFDTIRVQIDDRPPFDYPVKIAMHFDRPRSIGAVEQVADGPHRVTGVLLRDGGTVLTRAREVDIVADGDVLIAITRGTVGCGDASTCEIFADDCAVAACTLGTCMEAIRAESCAAEQRCLLGIGCVPASAECDGDDDCDDAIACTRDICGAGRCRNVPDDSECTNGRCLPFAGSSNGDTGCEPSCNSDTCVASVCAKAECIDNVCVRTPLCAADESCCDGVCAASCEDPRACENKPAGALCRPAYGACDAPETCDGQSAYCPADVIVAAGTRCRALAGSCDVEELCDGVVIACPPDRLVAEGTACRTTNFACDVPEACNGTSPACPSDLPASLGTICREASAVCDAVERCDGLAKDCPQDVLDQGSICRASAGPCDPAEVCDGQALACPPNAFADTSQVCRPAAGGCDLPDFCTGSSAACPADTLRAPGVSCRAADAEKPCDVGATCAGTATCPPNAFAPSTVICRAATAACDAAEHCTGTTYDCPPDAVAPASTICRPADPANPCDLADTSSGTSASCPPDALRPDGSLCGVISTQPPIPLICCSGSCLPIGACP